MSWYSTGYDGAHKEEQRIQSMSGPNRLWLPAGTGRELVLADDEPFCIYEHNAKLNGNWRNHHTCNRGYEDPCFSCAKLGEKSRAFTGYLTCVDCSEYVDKKGNKHQFELKLVGGKLGLVNKWKRKKADRGALTGLRWKVFREDSKKAATGDEWEVISEVKDPDKLFQLANYRGKKLTELWDKAEANPDSMVALEEVFQLVKTPDGKLVRRIAPFNYMKILHPRGNAYSKEILEGATVGDDDESSSSSSQENEDDIPF